MENLIRQIVEADSALRARVADCETQLAELRSKGVGTGHEQAYDRLHAEQTANAILRQAEEKIAKIEQNVEAEYEQAAAALRGIYQKNAAEWTAQLLANCLRTEDNR